MSGSCKKLVQVLKAELEDLLADIDHVEKRYSERFSSNEITEYVYRGNEAVLAHEAEGLRILLTFIDGIDISIYRNPSDLVGALERKVHDFVRDRDDPEAIFQFFMRKLRKAERYIAWED